MGNLFTIKQVAFILKVHQLTVRRYIREKKLPAIKISGLVRIKEEDLQKFQKEYSARRKLTQSLSKQVIKPFSFDDPLWQLDGVGASLSAPKYDE